MGFFNIYNEGQQAEEYKARKAKEAEEKEKAEAERVNRRIQAGTQTKTQNFDDEFYSGNPSARKDHNRAIDARRVVLRDEDHRAHNWRNTPMRYTKQDYTDDRDAVNRHMRRHPDQWDWPNRIKTHSEAYGIFESVEFLNEDWSSFSKQMDKQNAELRQKQSEMEKTRDDAMSQIHARHTELHKLLNRVEQQMKDNHKTDEADNREFDRRLANIDKELEDLLK